MADYLKKHQEDDAHYRDVEEEELSDFDDESENAIDLSEEFDSFFVKTNEENSFENEKEREEYLALKSSFAIFSKNKN